jgi:thioredoxin-related protein
MKYVLPLLLIFPIIIFGQIERNAPIIKGKGIQWEVDLNWKQIIARAKKSKKYIFLDCFTTWCGPCKRMDKEVYQNDTIGDYFNRQFLSVKLQMDTGINDDPKIQEWYSFAKDVMQRYKIGAFPSFLFFSPNGKIVHKAEGFKKGNDFILLAEAALDSEKQYYTMVDNYVKGNLSIKKMPVLADMARKLGEVEMSFQIARDYLDKYLNNLNEATFFKKENFVFINAYSKILYSSDRSFDWYFRHGDRIDSIMGVKGYAISLINAIVLREEINPAIESAQKEEMEPDWINLGRVISQKYGESYSLSNILAAKVNWYHYKKEWPLYTKYLVQKVEKSIDKIQSGIGGILYLNNNAWDIFKYSFNKIELENAIHWTDKAIVMDENTFPVMDTQANLLYKLGRKEEAIALEEKVLRMLEVKEGYDSYKKEYRETLVKMKNDIPTW